MFNLVSSSALKSKTRSRSETNLALGKMFFFQSLDRKRLSIDDLKKFSICSVNLPRVFGRILPSRKIYLK